MPYKDPSKTKKYREEHKEESKEYARQYYQDHKEWHSKYAKKYYEENKDAIKTRVTSRYTKNRDKILAYCKEYTKRPGVMEKIRKYKVMHHARCKALCIDHYSKGKNECALCRENRYKCLTIDHIKGGGKRHRDSINRHLSEWLIRNNFPEGFRILCWNCNCSIQSR